jgi:hypothetical protein
LNKQKQKPFTEVENKRIMIINGRMMEVSEGRRKRMRGFWRNFEEFEMHSE